MIVIATVLASGCTLGTALEAREDSLNATQTAQAMPTATPDENAVVLTPLEQTPGAIQLTPINLAAERFGGVRAAAGGRGD